MFSGIVSSRAFVVDVCCGDSFSSICLSFPSGEYPFSIGSSVAVNGVCLTVSRFSCLEGIASFDIVEETLRTTNLSSLKVGDYVNIERSLTLGAEIGGHIVSGHVDGTVRLACISRSECNCSLLFAVQEKFMKYIFPKGFVGLNGVSLTVGEVDKGANSFVVHLIPETLERTTFGESQEGDLVNLEVDRSTQIMVDTVNSFLDRLTHNLSTIDSPASFLSSLSCLRKLGSPLA